MCYSSSHHEFSHPYCLLLIQYYIYENTDKHLKHQTKIAADDTNFLFLKVLSFEENKA